MSKQAYVEPASETTPPRPILGDAVRDKAREEERRTLNKPLFSIRFGNPPPPPPVPQPPVSNPWRVLAETIPVDANTVRPVHPVRATHGTVVAGRSRFRKGVITLDPDGFTLTGVGVTPVGWLGKAGLGGYIGSVVFLLAASLGSWDSAVKDVMYSTSGIACCLGIFGYALESVVTEFRRGPQETRIFWDNVLEAQFEADGMRWVVVVYRTPERKPGVPGPVAYLAMNHLTLAVARALWDAIDAYAPGRTRSDGGVYRWTTGRRIAAGVIVGVLLIGILLLIRLII